MIRKPVRKSVKRTGLRGVGILLLEACICLCAAHSAAAAVLSEEELPSEHAAAAVLSGEEIPSEYPADGGIEEQIGAMTAEEKIDQMFIVLPEAVTGTDTVTAAGETFREALEDCAPGGYIFMEGNLQDPEQTREMLRGIRAAYEERGLPEPFLTLDEEGGSVSRIAKKEAFGVPQFPSAREMGQNGNTADAELMGSVIGGYLADLGFNMDLAPVADVLTNPENTVVASRSFGTNPQKVSAMARAVSEQMLQKGVIPVLKHFPGHGATAGDTHSGYAAADRTLEELTEAELVPFADACRYAPAMMAAHIALPEVTGDDLPASLSGTVITGILREKLRFEGIVMTDAMNMGAVVNAYSSGEAAVMAVEAGCDIILMPADFHAAREGLLEALSSGRLTEERIDASLRRILAVRRRMNGSHVR